MTPESALKKRIKAILDSEGIFWSAVKGGPHSKPGDPDLIACINGRFVGIEAKTYEGRPSEVQILRGLQIMKSGGMFCLVRSVDELWEVIERARESPSKSPKKRFPLIF